MGPAEELLTIKDWSPDDRPREKLLHKGKASLTDAELLAILLGSGTAKTSVVELGRKILVKAGNDLHALGKFTINDLTRIHGIGHAKAMTIVAALELGRRRKDSERIDKPKVSKSQDAYHLFQPDLIDIPHEEFWILLLNRANKVVAKRQISLGGVTGTVADPKIIFKFAIEELASGIILAHNHPSGNLTASQADLDLTKKLSAGARLLEMQVLDHLIIAGQKYFSFADEGLI